MRSIIMSRKKYTKEFKLKILKEHKEQGISFWKLGKDYGIEASIIRRWWHVFDAYGEEGLERHNSNLCNYSASFKQMVVKEYLAGGISQQSLAKKHGILAPSTISCWLKVYNNHEELTESRPKGDYLMVKDNKTRNTTLEERITIVEYCTANANNYALAAKEFDCSYGQVYSWVKKYEAQGIEGLYDRRGRKKPENELTELEKLQAENRLLKAQAKQQQMEIDFLKKLDAVERR
jgi:transposase-like protein